MAAPWLSGLTAPSLPDIEELAQEAYAKLPEAFRGLTGGVVILVEDFPSDDVLDEMKAGELDLLGLFQGVGLAHDAATPETGRMPNLVFLYRRPLIDEWADGGLKLGDLIAHVLIHEIGHHFGFSDDDMARIEDQAGLG